MRAKLLPQSVLRTLAVAVAMLPALSALSAVKTQDVTYTVDKTPYVGFLAYDDANDAKRPGILIGPEWVGLNDYARGRAKQLAEMGYVAFVFDPYGGGKNAADVKQSAEWSGALKADRPELRKRITAALETLKKQDRVDAKKIAAIGYCFGGTTVLELARSGADVQGVVSFHGGLSTTLPAKAGELKAKVLVCHGAIDPFVPPAEVAAFEKEMQDAKADWQLVSYGNAVHSFTNPAAKGEIPGAQYDEKADKRSWEAMTTFLREAFTPGTSVLVPEGPNGAVFADGKRARTVIFICDGSGTMVVKLQHLKVALSQAVDALHDDQQMMNVIFFSDGTATAFDSRANVIVNAATKAQAKAFIENASSRGSSEPFAAVRSAARLSADLVYFLADGEMEIPGTPNLVIDEFARANFHPMTRVNTILFENKEPGSERALKEIAAKYNGTYRYIPPND